MSDEAEAFERLCPCLIGRRGRQGVPVELVSQPDAIRLQRIRSFLQQPALLAGTTRDRPLLDASHVECGLPD